MSYVATGKTTATRTSWDQQFDPTSGWVTVETWQGTKPQIASVATIFRQSGAKTSVSNSGALWTLSATWNLEFNTDAAGDVPQKPPLAIETPTETWNLTVDLVQVDLRQSPALLALLGTAESVAGLVALADDAIKAKLGLNAYLTSVGLPVLVGLPLASATKIHTLRARGVEAIEERRPTLSRQRSYTPTYSTPIQVSGIDVIRTTATLIGAFNIPIAISQKLPTITVATLTDSAWGWKQRRQDSTYNLARNRIDETVDFVFAQWSTTIYSIT